jgi:hypothetical protein
MHHMVPRLDAVHPTLQDPRLQETVLNCSADPITGTVNSTAFSPRMAVVDASTGGEIGFVDDLQSFSIWLGAYGGVFLTLTPGELEA